MRRSQVPLLQSLLPDDYLFDTSAWLNIDLRADRDDVWSTIIRLIEKGRLFTCAQVLAEVREDPIYLLHLKAYEKALLAGDRDSNDMVYLLGVGRITHDYPSMCKATGRKTPADPYVVALAEMEGYVVVADESRKRPSRKIPGVCAKRNVRCIDLSEFVRANDRE
jgi:Domain of unknown function (DUF4411)